MKRYVPIYATAILVLAGIAHADVGPLELLKRAVDAHASLGAATLECKSVIAIGDQELNRDFVETVQRNDAEHSFTITKVLHGKYTDAETHQYVDGEYRVTYNPKDKEYGRSPDDHNVFKECLQAVKSGLLYPEQSNEWAKARVKAQKVDGAPVHTITVKNLGINHRDHPNPLSVTLSVDDQTGLVRKYVVGYVNDVSLTMTVKYTLEPKPFPASTFAFVAPPDAKESKQGKTNLK